MQTSNINDISYNTYLNQLRDHFLKEIKAHPNLFATSAADNIWNTYLNSFPESTRQYHNCHACRRFLEQYGHLAYMDEDFNLVSPIWNFPMELTPVEYQPAHILLKDLIQNSKPTGKFFTNTWKLGQPVTNNWHHLHLELPHGYQLTTQLTKESSAAQQNFELLLRAVTYYSPSTIDTAAALCQSDQLYRAEKIDSRLKWLQEIYNKRAQKKYKLANIIWSYVHSAPAGWCHVTSSVLGTLLDDIQAGKSADTIRKSFQEKLNPLQYQRPSAEITDQQIEAAEKAIKDLGYSLSLIRRTATPADIQKLWTPRIHTQSADNPDSIFSKLKSKSKSTNLISTDPVTITWIKFRDTILNSAIKIQVYIPPRIQPAVFTAAEHPDAPPIYQWDHPSKRNTVAWYFNSTSVYASNYNLTAGYHDVSFITLCPAHWDYPSENHKPFAAFVVKTAKINSNPYKSSSEYQSSAIFPECLKSELHPYRKVIEKYSKATPLITTEEQVIGLTTMSKLNIQVTTSNLTSTYVIDRWD